MMQRNAFGKLESLVRAGYRLPAILTGMRGVGKTTLACRFADEFFADRIYLNFENDPGLRAFFDLNSELELPVAVSRYLGSEGPLPLNVICILDEIMFSDSALSMFFRHSSALLYDETAGPSCSFIAVMSSCDDDLIPAELKESQVKVFPMTFDEYLCAGGHEWYVEIIRAHFDGMKKLPDMVHDELSDLFASYLETGGMPAAVLQQLGDGGVSFNGLEVRAGIYDHLAASALEEAGEDRAMAGSVLDTVPLSLSDNSRKFRFSLIRKGVTYSMCRSAINKLQAFGLVEKIDREGGEEGSFMLLLGDHGLLDMRLRRMGLVRETSHTVLVSATLLALKTAGLNLSYIDARSITGDFFRLADSSATAICIRRNATGRTRNISYSQGISGISDLRFVLSSDNFFTENGIRHIPSYAAFCIKSSVY